MRRLRVYLFVPAGKKQVRQSTKRPASPSYIRPARRGIFEYYYYGRERLDTLDISGALCDGGGSGFGDM